MKKLILVRHAKTEPIHSQISDFERNLLNKGVNDAHFVSLKMLEKKIIPDLIISSPARRAVETAEIFSQNLDFPSKDIVFNELIYNQYTTNDFINLLYKFPDKYETIMVFGHNPTLEILGYRFTNEFNTHIPTTGVLGIDFDVNSWKEIEAGKGKLRYFYHPKNID